MGAKELRIVFMGSPDFSLPTLRALHREYSVVGVVTQPDKPAGRGQHLTPPPVKLLADQLGIPTIQPKRLREEAAMQQLIAWAPDLIVVAAFGQILRPDVLDLPKHGCVNVHASLLPRWRGAAPIQAAILHGDRETGITIMKMDVGMDTGDMLSRHPLNIGEEETAGELSVRLSQLGAQALIGTLPEYLRGEIQGELQDEALATSAGKIEKSLGSLDFRRPVEELGRVVRACQPWPGAYTTWQDGMLKIQRAKAVQGKTPGPGVFTRLNKLPAIGTSDGLLVLQMLQPAGKKPMEGETFLRGAKDWPR